MIYVICMYTCVYVYVYVCVYVCICRCMYVYVCMCIYTHVGSDSWITHVLDVAIYFYYVFWISVLVADVHLDVNRNHPYYHLRWQISQADL